MTGQPPAELVAVVVARPSFSSDTLSSFLSLFLSLGLPSPLPIRLGISSFACFSAGSVLSCCSLREARFYACYYYCDPFVTSFVVLFVRPTAFLSFFFSFAFVGWFHFARGLLALCVCAYSPALLAADSRHRELGYSMMLLSAVSRFISV